MSVLANNLSLPASFPEFFFKYLFLKFYLFSFGCAGSWLLCRHSVVAVSGGCSLAAVHELLIEVTSLTDEHKLLACRPQ